MRDSPTILSLAVGLIVLSAVFPLDQVRRVAATRRTWASSLPPGIQIFSILLVADLLA